MNYLRSLCAALLVLAACSKSAPVAPPVVLPPEVTGAVLPTMPAGHPDLTSLKVASRGPRRLSVDQIEHSLDSIGNIPTGSVKLPADLAFTLGRPDYRRVTEEALDPSPLFMKFMVDLSGFLCDSLAQFEQNPDGGPSRPQADRIFTRLGSVDGGSGDSAIIDANLAFMLQRFTSIEGEDAKPYLVRLRKAYDTGKVSPKMLGGYQAACQALFNSPEFLLY